MAFRRHSEVAVVDGRPRSRYALSVQFQGQSTNSGHLIAPAERVRLPQYGSKLLYDLELVGSLAVRMNISRVSFRQEED